MYISNILWGRKIRIIRRFFGDLFYIKFLMVFFYFCKNMYESLDYVVIEMNGYLFVKREFYV